MRVFRKTYYYYKVKILHSKFNLGMSHGTLKENITTSARYVRK